MPLPTVELSAIGRDEANRRWNDQFLTHEDGPRALNYNIAYTHEGKLKFVLLPRAIKTKVYNRSLLSLQTTKFNSAKNTRRSAVAQSFGGEVLMGYMKPCHQTYKCWMTAPTRDQRKEFHHLFRLVTEINKIVEENLPEYYLATQEIAYNMWRPEDAAEDFPDPKVRNRLHSDWDLFYLIRGTIFSTLTLNRSIVFKAHADKHNVEGTLGCLTPFGDYAGGTLVFPRFGVRVEVKPHDLLIADTNEELHGNLGPIVGERYSVVAYLHESLQGRADHNWEGVVSRNTDSGQRPAVWCCKAGMTYPEDAVYVGCRVRRGKVSKKGSIFGNGTNPLVSHKGGRHTEGEFRAYAIEKLRDPAFRAEAEKLRGKDLLCWCVQEGKDRAEFCHARVWLDLINNPQGPLARPDLHPEQRRDFDWGYYEPSFLSKEEADALFAMAKAQPRLRPKIKRSGYALRRCASTCWSVRDRNDDSVAMVPLAETPSEILSLQRKLSGLAGKEVNYFSLQAYENERDHIDFHQHREDKCRDARVFIISLGERRSFAVDKLCPQCLLCDNCNRRRCHPGGPPCSNYSKCQAAKKHRRTCAVRKSTKTILLPAHGSLIALTSEANDWYEHAVLDDEDSKGLRMSINTKCIPLEDAAAGYVPRELRHGGGFAHEDFQNKEE